jgi:hypothetical protein
MEKGRSLECTEKTNNKDMPLKCTEMGKKTPLECTEMEKGRRQCSLLAFLRVEVVFGSRTLLIIMSAYCMPLGSCGG